MTLNIKSSKPLSYQVGHWGGLTVYLFENYHEETVIIEDFGIHGPTAPSLRNLEDCGNINPETGDRQMFLRPKERFMVHAGPSDAYEQVFKEFRLNRERVMAMLPKVPELASDIWLAQTTGENFWRDVVRRPREYTPLTVGPRAGSDYMWANGHSNGHYNLHALALMWHLRTGKQTPGLLWILQGIIDKATMGMVDGIYRYEKSGGVGTGSVYPRGHNHPSTSYKQFSLDLVLAANLWSGHPFLKDLLDDRRDGALTQRGVMQLISYGERGFAREIMEAHHLNLPILRIIKVNAAVETWRKEKELNGIGWFKNLHSDNRGHPAYQTCAPWMNLQCASAILKTMNPEPEDDLGQLVIEAVRSTFEVAATPRGGIRYLLTADKLPHPSQGDHHYGEDLWPSLSSYAASLLHHPQYRKAFMEIPLFPEVVAQGLSNGVGEWSSHQAMLTPSLTPETKGFASGAKVLGAYLSCLYGLM